MSLILPPRLVTVCLTLLNLSLMILIGFGGGPNLIGIFGSGILGIGIGIRGILGIGIGMGILGIRGIGMGIRGIGGGGILGIGIGMGIRGNRIKSGSFISEKKNEMSWKINVVDLEILVNIVV